MLSIGHAFAKSGVAEIEPGERCTLGFASGWMRPSSRDDVGPWLRARSRHNTPKLGHILPAARCKAPDNHGIAGTVDPRSRVEAS